MPLKLCELLGLLLSALVTGMFFGPWAALSRSFHTFPPDVFLPVVHRMGRNVGAVMTMLMPAALLSLLPVLALSYGAHPLTFFLTLAGLALFAAALAVTMAVEVPIVHRMESWTPATLPDGWQASRDRWGSFHVVRVSASILGLLLLLAGAIF